MACHGERMRRGVEAGAGEPVASSLRAVLLADIAGYSRLMGQDEPGTHRRVTAILREIVAPAVREHRGRLIRLLGDSVLADFASAADAVQCAIAIQRGTDERNAALAKDQRIRFRIGVNAGEAIVEENDIFGECVNIAARLEALAEPGEIFVSGAVYEQVRDRLGVRFDRLGAQAVKNIRHPVRIYAVRFRGRGTRRWRWLVRRRRVRIALAALGLAAGIAAAVFVEPWRGEESRGLSQPPSVAVLPFANLSGPGQGYICDGLTEDILDALAKLPGLVVIAHKSSAVYGGKAAPVGAVARALGARYILAGAVQRSGDALRITAQLVDSATGHPLWSEKYDRKLSDLFAVEDELTFKIATALQVTLTEGEKARLAAGSTKDLEAWEYYVEAEGAAADATKAGNEKARGLLEKAVKADPHFAAAWSMLAFTYFADADFGWVADIGRAAEQARGLALHAEDIAPDYPGPHLLLARLDVRDPEQRNAALAEAQKAVRLAPGDAAAHWTLGVVLYALKRYGEAAAEVGTAERLQPRYDESYPGLLALILDGEGQIKAAIAEAQRAVARAPDHALAYFYLARVLYDAGRYEAAIAALVSTLRYDPQSSPQYFTLLAAAYDHLGEPDRALGVLGGAVERWPNDLSVRLWLAISYGLAGRIREARSAMSIVRRISPQLRLREAREDVTLGRDPQFRKRAVAIERAAGLD
jgi:adenylate cyclase